MDGIDANEVAESDRFTTPFSALIGVLGRVAPEGIADDAGSPVAGVLTAVLVAFDDGLAPGTGRGMHIMPGMGSCIFICIPGGSIIGIMPGIIMFGFICIKPVGADLTFFNPLGGLIDPIIGKGMAPGALIGNFPAELHRTIDDGSATLAVTTDRSMREWAWSCRVNAMTSYVISMSVMRCLLLNVHFSIPSTEHSDENPAATKPLVEDSQ